MSKQPWFSMVTGAAQRPNGSIPNPAVSASVLGKIVRDDAGSEKAPAYDAIFSVAVPADRQGPADVRPPVSAWDGLAIRPTLAAPRREQKGRLRRVCRAAAGVLGMLVLLLVFARWVLIPMMFPMASVAWWNTLVVVVKSVYEGSAQVRLRVGQAVERGEKVADLFNSDVDPSQLAQLTNKLTMAKAEQRERRCALQAAKDFEQLAHSELE